jgi:uncharacterized protein YggE
MLAVFAAALLLAQAAPPPPRTVHTFGEGRISVAPDIARVAVGVDAQDQNLARANADATARMNRVMAAIEKAGIAAKDVQTLRYSVMADARARALVLAKAAGGSLGEALQVNEMGPSPIVPFAGERMKTAAVQGGAPVSAGELEIDANVEVVFALR